MKKVSFILLFIVFSTMQAFAQFGLGTGINLAQLQVYPLAGTISPMVSGQIGFFYDIQVSDRLFFTPGLKLVTKGAKHDYTLEIDLGTRIYKVDVNANIRLLYLEIPLDLTHRTPANFFIGGGPYFAFGVDAIDAEFGPEWDKYNPFDFGVNLKAGKQFGITSLALQYSQGIMNISSIENTSLRNSLFSLTGTIYFKQPKKKQAKE